MRRSPFPPIADYGFLSDCYTGALVSTTGAVEWLCLPRFDEPSVFGAILDRDAGHFRLAPSGVKTPISRRYLPGTLILETTWTTSTGWLVIRDALTVRGWQPELDDELVVDQSAAMRPRTDHECDSTLIRTATCVDGQVEVELDCLPVFGYGAEPAQWSIEGRTATAEGAGQKIRLDADFDLRLDNGRAVGGCRLDEGDRCFASVCWSDDPGPPTSAEDALARLAHTSDFWRVWLRHGTFPDHPWRIHLQRSALVLKGLTYAPTGAIVAAPTTSLPETPGGERNWDYRYSWIRDATFTLWALHILGFEEEARDFANFFTYICRKSPELQIMYGIEGETDLRESTLDHLSGYEGARPVRIGNAAFAQRQNDVWGALLDSIYLHSKALGELPEEMWELIKDEVEAAIRAWPHPDHGIWEARGKPRHYVASKLMMWVAVDRGARLARAREDADLAGRWEQVAEGFREEILARGVRDGVFRQHYDTDALDAATLLVPLVRFLPPDDPRVHDTVLTIAEQLTADGFVLRYLVEETDDGLRGAEGTFLLCSFWMVSALSEIGEPDRAQELCERLLSVAGPLGLYAEELDPVSGRHLGNFPQAFTHLALINAVAHVIADETREETGKPTAVFTELGGPAR